MYRRASGDSSSMCPRSSRSDSFVHYVFLCNTIPMCLLHPFEPAHRHLVIVFDLKFTSKSASSQSLANPQSAADRTHVSPSVVSVTPTPSRSSSRSRRVRSHPPSGASAAALLTPVSAGSKRSFTSISANRGHASLSQSPPRPIQLPIQRPKTASAAVATGSRGATTKTTATTTTTGAHAQRRPATSASTRPGTASLSARSRAGLPSDLQYVVGLCTAASVEHNSGGGGGASHSIRDASAVGMCILELTNMKCALSQFTDSPSFVRTLQRLLIHPPSKLIVPLTMYHPRKSEAAMILDANLTAETSLYPVKRALFSAAAGLAAVQSASIAERTLSLEASLSTRPLALAAFAAVVKFMETKLDLSLTPGSAHIAVESALGAMLIDVESAKQLELVQSQNGPHGTTLFSIVNKCNTKMGQQLLRAAILQPPCDIQVIELRQAAVNELTASNDVMETIAAALKSFPDVGRLVSALVREPSKMTPKSSELKLQLVLDIRRLLSMVPDLQASLAPCNSQLLRGAADILADLALNSLSAKLHETLDEHLDSMPNTPSGTVQRRAFAVRSGIHGMLDVARRTYQETEGDIYQLINDYSSQFDFAIKPIQTSTEMITLESRLDPGMELPDVFVNRVVRHNKVRFTTLEIMKLNQRLKESQAEIYLMSDLYDLNLRFESLTGSILFDGIDPRIIQTLMQDLRSNNGTFYRVAEAVALVDMLVAMAKVTFAKSYTMPRICGELMAVTAARHPLLESVQERQIPVPGIPAALFHPNDIYADFGCNVQIVTGANMAGKTTYLKQTALLTILAHIGCGVPAESALIRLTDRIATRFNFNDSLATNASSFTVEMRDMAVILAELEDARDPTATNTTSHSALILVDELGRGTSPTEAVSISYAVVEALAASRAFVWFATHLHDLSRLCHGIPNVISLHFDHQQHKQQQQQAGVRVHALAFSHALVDGPMDAADMTGYGIALAATLDFPPGVLDRATQVAQQVVSRFPLSANAVESSASDPSVRRAVHETARRIMAIAVNPRLAPVEKMEQWRALQVELRPYFDDQSAEMDDDDDSALEGSIVSSSTPTSYTIPLTPPRPLELQQQLQQQLLLSVAEQSEIENLVYSGLFDDDDDDDENDKISVDGGGNALYHRLTERIAQYNPQTRTLRYMSASSVTSAITSTSARALER
ncbi:muts domain V-domain-containing protein [Blastocladiella britannica]|nr:muts domain V-domain-containing protein [Blastocladiella britannica]